jgi:hypothetical protein
MYIEINDNTTLRYIQETFSAYYPYLQIGFYSKPHRKYESSDKEDLLHPGKMIEEVKTTHVYALLEIQPSNKVADVEKEFLLRFGLSVQVFWKDKNTWRQTTGLDDFSLKELNELGRNSSDEFIVSDYEESFDEPPK